MDDLPYNAIRGLASLLMSSFFSQVEVDGLENVPKEGPVIFASVHPNALVDPALVLVHCSRHVRIISKDQLFHLPVMKTILKAIKAVPVKRAADSGNKEGGGSEAVHLNNTSMFSEVWKALDAGDAIAIFPEGTTEMVSHIRKIKTGTARIALGFGKEHRSGSNQDKQDLRIVPVGLNYTNRNRYRSQVLLSFGRPIVIDDKWKERYEKEEWTAVTELTSFIQASLESITITAPDWSTLKVMTTAKNIMKPSYEQDIKYDVELTRRFLVGYQSVLSNLKEETNLDEIAKISQMRTELEDYQYTLDALGLTDKEVQKLNQYKKPFVDHLFNDFVVWPLALIGVILNFPIPIATKLLGSIIARGEIVEELTYKMVAAMASALLTYSIIGSLLWYHYGFLFTFFAVLFMVLTGMTAVAKRPLNSTTSFLRSLYKVVPKDLQKKREDLRQRMKEMTMRYSQFDTARKDYEQ
ncbi:putative acyltransferase [Planoprotostelium fungivorum]|uniref:Putative acyltransferase n=1 Tax=Planoprotostelium fungivorum TaxID=1890364 RepID=A0A2P6MQT5_9EUKA|nr:putative acyltransferase [Planoprotostelium fungivorum]